MFRNIYTQLFFYVLAIGAGFATGFILLYLGYYLTASVSLVLSVLVFITTVQYTKKGFRELSQVLEAMSFKDTTVVPYTSKKPESLKLLFSKISSIRKEYQELVNEGEDRLIFLKELVEELPIGIIAFGKSGNILVFNGEGSRILGLGKITHLDRLKNIRPVFYKRTQQILSGGSALFSYQKDDLETKLIIRKLTVSIRNEEVETLIFQPIDAEYGRLEMRSWDKLLGILTHEIANSITAISSLSQSAISIANSEKDISTDLHTALEGVHRRSDKLLRFVSDYRALAEMPQPKVEAIDLRFLMQTMSEEWALQESNIKIEMTCPGNLTLLADEGQLILCFENFFLNSIHALKDTASPVIRFAARQISERSVEIQFQDNGKGMAGEVDRAIIPFFTTRPDGKGIGLALARQIVRAHNGTLSVKNAKPGFEVTIRIPTE